MEALTIYFEKEKIDPFMAREAILGLDWDWIERAILSGGIKCQNCEKQICGEVFEMEYNGTKYHFCSNGCATEFIDSLIYRMEGDIDVLKARREDFA